MKPPAKVAVAEFDKEAGQTRDYCVAKNATLRAARSDPSLRKRRLLGMKIKEATGKSGGRDAFYFSTV